MYVCIHVYKNLILFKLLTDAKYLFYQIHCLDVVLQDMDVVKGITEYVYYAAIENLVLGAASRHGFIRYCPTELAILNSNNSEQDRSNMVCM